MSGRLLDTDTLINLARGEPIVTNRYAEAMARGDALYVSTLSVFEFRYGIERSARHAEQAPAFALLLGTVQVEPFDLDDSAMAARIKADLTARGAMIGGYDLLIGAQALRRDLVLATGNVREFSRLPGLRLEDWRSPD